MTGRHEVKWNIPFGGGERISESERGRPSQSLTREESDEHPTELNRSFVRRSSQAVSRSSIAVGRRLSDAFALLSGRNDNEDDSTDSSEDEANHEGLADAARRRSSGGRQPCGHNHEKATEYNEVGRRSMCQDDLTPRPRRKKEKSAVAGPSKERKRRRKRRVPVATEEVDGQTRRVTQSYRHSHIPSASSTLVTGDAIYAQPIEKESIKRIGKMPEGRTFRQPMPFTVSPAIRSQ